MGKNGVHMRDKSSSQRFDGMTKKSVNSNDRMMIVVVVSDTSKMPPGTHHHLQVNTHLVFRTMTGIENLICKVNDTK